MLSACADKCEKLERSIENEKRNHAAWEQTFKTNTSQSVVVYNGEVVTDKTRSDSARAALRKMFQTERNIKELVQEYETDCRCAK